MKNTLEIWNESSKRQTVVMWNKTLVNKIKKIAQCNAKYIYIRGKIVFSDVESAEQDSSNSIVLLTVMFTVHKEEQD